MKSRLFFSIYLLCGLLSILSGGTDGQVRGKITNLEGEPLVGAQIYIEKLDEVVLENFSKA